MTIIEKIENGKFDLSEFTESQVNFIKSLVKSSYMDGCEDGISDIKDRLLNSIKNKPLSINCGYFCSDECDCNDGFCHYGE